jgi:hypothetical protein
MDRETDRLIAERFLGWKKQDLFWLTPSGIRVADQDLPHWTATDSLALDLLRGEQSWQLAKGRKGVSCTIGKIKQTGQSLAQAICRTIMEMCHEHRDSII